MLQITKQGNSIVVEGLNHYFYPYNGTLEVPCNSVITVVDEGDIVLFRSASNYDVLFSAKIDEITINGQSVTKDNVGEVFGALSNVSSGGGGLTPEQEEKLNNALQEETDPVWTAEKGNYYTKSEVNSSLETKADKTEIPTVPTKVSAFTNDAGYLTQHQSLDNYYTKSEINTSLESKANKTEIPTVPTKVSEFTNDAGYLTQHQTLKTINGETIVGDGNIEITSGEETDPIWTAEKGNYYTKSEVDTSLETKADKSEIPSLNGYATEQWVGQQGYLTEHQPLKTINGETIVGNGDITISGGEPISDILVLPQNVEFTYKDGNKYIVKIRDISYNSHGGLDFSIAIWENGAAPTDIRKIGYITKSGSSEGNYSFDYSTYGFKIDAHTDIPDYVYIYSDDDNAIDENKMYFDLDIPLKSGTTIKTINGESILGSGDIVISGGGEETDPIWNAEKGNYYTKTEVNSSLETKANKSEIPTVPTNVSEFTNDAGYLTQHQTLKTINGETIVGDGNIEITSGEETDPVWTAEKVNYYTKSEVNTSLEAKANKTEIPSLNGYATEQWVGQQGYLTEHQSLDNYYTKSEIDGIVGNVNNALGEIING